MNLQLTPIASAVALVLMNTVIAAQAQQAPAAPAPAASAVPAAAEPAASAPAAAAPAAAASAPEAKAPQQLETVTITGIRASLATAVNIKKNATAVVDAVSAEDVGKLPDSD